MEISAGNVVELENIMVGDVWICSGQSNMAHYTGMVVTIDLGEWNNIHPGNKKPVGEKLALAAQKVVYGEEDIVLSGRKGRGVMLPGGRKGIFRKSQSDFNPYISIL